MHPRHRGAQGQAFQPSEEVVLHLMPMRITQVAFKTTKATPSLSTDFIGPGGACTPTVFLIPRVTPTGHQDAAPRGDLIQVLGEERCLVLRTRLWAFPWGCLL